MTLFRSIGKRLTCGSSAGGLDVDRDRSLDAIGLVDGDAYCHGCSLHRKSPAPSPARGSSGSVGGVPDDGEGVLVILSGGAAELGVDLADRKSVVLGKGVSVRVDR